MNSIINKKIIPYFVVIAVGQSVDSQEFANLNFESANVTGFSKYSIVPITMALPGWSACVFDSSETDSVTQIVLDGISTGGAAITLVDTNVGSSSFNPIQGKYSVWLFGGGSSGVYGSAQISQTGLVPVGTESLRLDAYNAVTPFVVTLGGQVVNMIPLQTFSNYTLYGGDISSFAGDVETLSITEPPAPVVQPSFLELDNIQFSPTQVVPEPGEFALAALGGLLFGWNRWRKSSR